jgi:hypothetical protein
MKNLKALVFAMSVLAFTSLQAQTSNLIVFSENGERFNLILNGIRQNADYQTNVRITDLVPTQYKIRLLFEDANIPNLDKNIMFDQPSEITFVVKQTKKGKYVMRMMSQVPIAQAPPAPPTQNIITYTTVAPSPSVTVTETTTTTTSGSVGVPGESVSMGVSIGQNGANFNMNVNVNDQMGAETISTTTTSTTYSSTTTEPVQVVEVSGPCAAPMYDAEFADAKGSIARKDFEDTKLSIAKQITSANCLLSSQVYEIMMLFEFEDSKLEFATFAYGYTFDPEKYYMVHDAFEFETTVEDLNSTLGL